MVQENSILRAVILGTAVSVDETFYDSLIKRNIPDGTFKEAILLRDVLLDSNYAIPICWIQLRIQKMIEDGELIIVEDNEEHSKRIIKKA